MTRKLQASLLVILTVYSTLLANNRSMAIEADCTSRKTCGSCLQTPNCIWCKQVKTTAPQCWTKDIIPNKVNYWCNEVDVIKADTEITVLEERPVLSTKNESVQISPQRIHVRVRIGDVAKFNVKYRQAENYPVDLYYLMDLSASMEPYKNHLSKLGHQIADALSKLTSNVRIGFGSFIDKVILPMNNYREIGKDADWRKSCVLPSGNKCDLPYGYKNQMPLTDDIDLFKTLVENAPMSANLDSPEGGLDAIMQAIVCTDKVGWRNRSRRLIVFSTDNTYYVAGSGRLAGIIEPNDCLCHIDDNGFYNYSLLQDYPSISQINRKVKEHNVIVIFAVPSHMNDVYQQLSQSISGSSIGILRSDSKNVVDLVSHEYEKLVESVTLTDNASKLLKIKYLSKCTDENSDLIETNKCHNITKGQAVEFEISIEALECPQDSAEWNQTVIIKPTGLNESLVVHLDLVCDCPCERINSSMRDAKCNYHGNMKCGVCSCDDGFYGKLCECDKKKVSSDSSIAQMDVQDCRPNKDSSEICSGQGICKCGVCECIKRADPNELFYGKHCECDNFSCKRNEGLICNGQGICECGQCNCFPGWSGETCDCRESNDTCILDPMNSEEICSGHGDCICGNCHCHEKDGTRYLGHFCEECSTCSGRHCSQLKDCVECTVHGTGELANNGSCWEYCYIFNFLIDTVDETAMSQIVKNPENNVHICRAIDSTGCTILFSYTYHKSQDIVINIAQISAQKTKICPEKLNVFKLVIKVTSSIVILGLLMLVSWKIVVVIHDNKEFAKFEEERVLVRWEKGENPLYKKATATFANPTFDNNGSRE